MGSRIGKIEDAFWKIRGSFIKRELCNSAEVSRVFFASVSPSIQKVLREASA